MLMPHSTWFDLKPRLLSGGLVTINLYCDTAAEGGTTWASLHNFNILDFKLNDFSGYALFDHLTSIVIEEVVIEGKSLPNG